MGNLRNAFSCEKCFERALDINDTMQAVQNMTMRAFIPHGKRRFAHILLCSLQNNKSETRLVRLSSSSHHTECEDQLRRKMLEKIIRVDHAGEMGASFIYQGQMAVLKNTKSRDLIQEMWDHEKAHLAKFEELLLEYQVKPTLLIPVWKLAGFTLGAGCSLLGEKGAMACTVAVEALVTKHYDDQVTEMLSNNPRLDENLIEIVKKFRDDEQSHHDIGLAHGAEEAPGYNFLTAIIGFGCRNAIWISERI